jgi:DNA polymerase-1
MNLFDEMEINNDKQQTFIFIDGSYFCFYRYHSLITWWKNAYPDNLDVLQNPYENTSFVDKFKKTFIDTVKNIPKKLKLDKLSRPFIIVGKDCKRANIWRNELFPKYKANRDNSPESGFMGGPFFKMAYDDELFIQGGVTTILKHPKLEADDCIAISVKYILNKWPNASIYIITSDKDYLQLAGENVHIYNLAFKSLTEQKSCTGDPLCDLFCKTVTGDPSDNIPSVFPKCGIKTALKYFTNKDLFEKKLQESELYQQQYYLNKNLVDFNNIPQEIVNEFLYNMKSI